MIADFSRTDTTGVHLGVALPNRGAGHADVADLTRAAVLAEELGFSEVWVTDNALGDYVSLDAVTVLSHVAAHTERVGLGVAVVVLPLDHPIHVARRVATLDRLSGGRAMLAVGLGRASQYAGFGVPTDRRVGRFREAVHHLRVLWGDEADDGRAVFHDVGDVRLAVTPLQRPMPIWLGGEHPDAVRRAARIGDGWVGGGGGGGLDVFRSQVRIIREQRAESARDIDDFPIAKRVFLAVDRSPERANALLREWFAKLYGDPSLADTRGLAGTPDDVAAGLSAYVEAGATHLVLHPVADPLVQIEHLAEIASPLRRAGGSEPDRTLSFPDP